jgi:hypothetical protein
VSPCHFSGLPTAPHPTEAEHAGALRAGREPECEGWQCPSHGRTPAVARGTAVCVSGGGTDYFFALPIQYTLLAALCRRPQVCAAAAHSRALLARLTSCLRARANVRVPCAPCACPRSCAWARSPPDRPRGALTH